jgi:hypothetical protein
MLSLSLGQDLNQEPSKYKSEALLLDTAWLDKTEWLK